MEVMIQHNWIHLDNKRNIKCFFQYCVANRFLKLFNFFFLILIIWNVPFYLCCFRKEQMQVHWLIKENFLFIQT